MHARRQRRSGQKYIVVIRFKPFNVDAERVLAEHVRHVNDQARGKPKGLLSPSVLRKRPEGYYTITEWSSVEAKETFENSGEHLRAKQESPTLGETEHFGYYSEEFPSFEEARQKLEEHLTAKTTN